jgi:hypothetical protein
MRRLRPALVPWMRALISAAASNDVQQGAKADALRFEPVRRRAHPSDLRHGKLVPLGGALVFQVSDISSDLRTSLVPAGDIALATIRPGRGKETTKKLHASQGKHSRATRSGRTLQEGPAQG